MRQGCRPQPVSRQLFFTVQSTHDICTGGRGAADSLHLKINADGSPAPRRVRSRRMSCELENRFVATWLLGIIICIVTALYFCFPSFFLSFFHEPLYTVWSGTNPSPLVHHAWSTTLGYRLCELAQDTEVRRYNW